MKGDVILFFLVIFPIVGAFISYLIGKKSKLMRDYFAGFVCILDLIIILADRAGADRCHAFRNGNGFEA